MRRMVLAGVVLATLMASGCASAVTAPNLGEGHAVPTSGTTAPVQTKNDCAAYAQSVKSGGDGAQSPAGTLPADAHPVSLLECVVAEQDVAGEGEWQVVNTVRSTGSVSGFVSALRAAYVKPPQSSPTKLIACSAVGYAQPWIVLLDDDGTAYRIAIPFWGVCPAPDPDVLKALAAVKTTIASTERIRQTLSVGAQSSGCDQQFAEMAFVGARANGSGTGAPFISGTNPVKTFRVCFYRLAGAYDKAKPAGDFESAATISGGQAALVYDGLMSAPVAAGKNCVAPATEYATLFADADQGNWSVVELGGCRLASPGSGPDRQVPSSVIQALLAAKK